MNVCSLFLRKKTHHFFSLINHLHDLWLQHIYMYCVRIILQWEKQVPHQGWRWISLLISSSWSISQQCLSVMRMRHTVSNVKNPQELSGWLCFEPYSYDCSATFCWTLWMFLVGPSWKMRVPFLVVCWPILWQEMNKSGYIPFSPGEISAVLFPLETCFSSRDKWRERVGEQTQGAVEASQTYFFLFSARYHLFLKVLYFLFSLLGNMVQTRIRWFLSAPGWIIELCHVWSWMWT